MRRFAPFHAGAHWVALGRAGTRRGAPRHDRGRGARQGAAAGARRARLSQGQNGFHAALNEMPPGFVVPPHSHSDAELFVVLAGSCTVADGTRLAAGDVASIPARMEYGFEVGPEGLRFVVVRASDAGTTLRD